MTKRGSGKSSLSRSEKRQASTMPIGCLSLGFDGYKAAGLEPPRETVWAGHVGERLASVGSYLVPNVAGAMHSGLPDFTLHTNFGVLYLEFKGLDTPVRGNQAAVACSYNTKALYSRGEFICFVYKAPNILGILKADGGIHELAYVDALLDPIGFVNRIRHESMPIVRGTRTARVDCLVRYLGLQELPKTTFDVVCRDIRGDFTTRVDAVSPTLALKQATGHTEQSAEAVGFKWVAYDIGPDYSKQRERVGL